MEKEETDKVYCKNCKYFNSWTNSGSAWADDTCTNPSLVLRKYTAIDSYTVEPTCDQVNYDNNCPFYEKRKWYYIRKCDLGRLIIPVILAVSLIILIMGWIEKWNIG